MTTIRKTDCRLCGSRKLLEVLNLGYTPLADRFLLETYADVPYVFYELILMQCSSCGWNQLSNVVDPKILYQEDYPYDASVTFTGKRHWNEFAASSLSQYGNSLETKVIDIGSNVGALLSSFQKLGAKCMGIDPSATAAEKALKSGVSTKIAFFNRKVAEEILTEFGHVDIATGTNVVAHVDDLVDFFSGIRVILGPTGVFQFEAPYFGNLVNNLQFDTIYHEHLSYLSIKPMIRFLAKQGLEIIKIEEHPIHGGSLRVDVARIGARKVDGSVTNFVNQENSGQFNSPDVMKMFAENVRILRRSIRKTILEVQESGKKLAIASAPAKGMTLLHYTGLNHEDFIAISDSAHQKREKLLPGIMVRVSSDSDMQKLSPEYVLILAWNFKEEIINNLKLIFPETTKFIIPIPSVEVI
jgi:SAM-dependent methyltransferase